WLLGGMDKGLHTLVATPRPLEPDLRAAQRDMLLGVFTLADTTVDEVMTPRLDMIAVDVAATADEVRETFHQSEHSRLPVYDGTPGNLVGIVYAKDLVPLVLGVAGATVRWQDLVRPALYVPETKTLDSQLRDFQRGPSHLAIVVDEFGGTSGLITLEDILEEIVGEIRDEHDVETPPAIRQEGDRYVVDGRASLGELSEALGAAFEHPDVSTVGGLIYSALGRVPRPGESRPGARHGQRAHHARRAQCRRRPAGAARSGHAHVPRRLHDRGRRAAVRERRVPRAPRGGTPLGRGDRGARGSVARARGTRARAVHPGA